MSSQKIHFLRRVFISPDELAPIIDKVMDPDFKGGLMVTLSKVLYMNQVHFKEYIYYICRVEKIYLSSWSESSNI